MLPDTAVRLYYCFLQLGVGLKSKALDRSRSRDDLGAALAKTVWRTTLLNQVIVLAYLLNVPPDRLVRWYRQG